MRIKPNISDLDVEKIAHIKNYHWSQEWAAAAEAGFLCQYLQTYNIKTAVETGTSNGFTSACMAWVGGARVYTFDIADKAKIYEWPKLIGEFTELYGPLKGLVKFKAIPSPECFDTLSFPKERDSILFFLDGDHSTEGVNQDYRCAMKIAQPGDLLFFHDVWNHPDVAQFWVDLGLEFPDKTTTIASRNGLGLFKV